MFAALAIVKARATPDPFIGPTRLAARAMLTANDKIPARVGERESLWA